MALAGGAANFLLGPLQQLGLAFQGNVSLPVRSGMRKWWVLAIVPTAVVLVFFAIFYAANPDFARIIGRIIQHAWDAVVAFFEQFSWLHLFFLLLGAFVIAGFLFRKAIEMFYERERNFSTALYHNDEESKPLAAFGLSQLADETKAGILMLVLVNILALAVNIIDIKTQWLGFKFHEGMNLASNVHEGTGLLIFSILLAMGILLYLFRGNQNFTEQTTTIKALAYAWIFQNAILCISVGIRNYHYIENFGLAYKRIGVIFFLGLTLFGLVTMFLKVLGCKPANYLFKWNSWAVYFTLLTITCFNWDLLIAQYNLKYHTRMVLDVENEVSGAIVSSSARERYVDHTDKYFLLSLSDKSLQAFINHPEFLTDSVYYSSNYSTTTVKNKYEERVRQFIDRKQHEGFLSWNYAESLTWKELNKKHQ